MPNEKRAPYDFNRVMKFTPQDPDMPRTEKMRFERAFHFIAPNPAFSPESPYSQRYVSAIDLRIYWPASPSGSVCKAKLWAHSRDGKTWTRGHGSAGGYDKESAAAMDAVNRAGFELEADFGGCGDRPMQIGLEAITHKLGWHTGQVMRFHG